MKLAYARYAMSGTDLAYGAVAAYVRATPCPVSFPTRRPVLMGRTPLSSYAMPGIDLARGYLEENQEGPTSDSCRTFLEQSPQRKHAAALGDGPKESESAREKDDDEDDDDDDGGGGDSKRTPLRVTPGTT
eukprot:1098955-Rhodomonas_salina.1